MPYMNLKDSLLLLATSVCIPIFSGCTTQVAIDPQTGLEQSATYTAGYFFANVDASISETFRAAAREMEGMGYFRTGERHGKDSIRIYARKVGDQKITVSISNAVESETEGQTEIRIRVGKLGNLAESQVLYARIRDSLI
ncbi:MAG: Uncharacterised protein [Opitutia bacterium UBA7350]|nr:MAG: Uncharacterised protein [Opitutae bacterium UBA7350]